MTAATREGRRYLNWDIAISVLAIVLIFYTWGSSHLYVFIPWARMSWAEYKTAWCFYFGAVAILLVMMLWSYFMAAFTNPGEINPARIRSFRWCSRCAQPKPPRAHHCHHGCDRCILKMDHHCPWIANCVGFRNHGHFLRFLLYTWTGALLTEMGLLTRFAQFVWGGRGVATIFIDPDISFTPVASFPRILVYSP